MTAVTLITQTLLDQVGEAAKASPRGRKNHNFHPTDLHPAHRLLNAIEPGSYVVPHRHLDPHKDESMLVLRGRLGLVTFDAAGRISGHTVLAPQGEALGVDIPHDTYHSVLGLEPGTIFFEAKAGPYIPLTAEERAPWAPVEGSPEAAAYYAGLTALFR